MKEVPGVKLSGSLISLENTVVPPVPDGHLLIKVKELMITPINILFQGDKPFLGIISGTEIETGKNVVSVGVCKEHGFYDLSFVGWSLTPYPAEELMSVGNLRDLQVLFPIVSMAYDAAEKSLGDTLVISRGGLLYALYSQYSTGAYRLYAGSGCALVKKEPFVSPEKLRESSWDTVIVLTIDRSLVSDALSLIRDAKRVLYSPMFSCLSSTLLAKCAGCSVGLLSLRRWPEEERSIKPDKSIVSKFIERVNAGDLPVVVSKPYVVIDF